MPAVTSAYLSCQFSNWMGIAVLAATDSQIAYYVARIITTAVVFAILLHWASDIGPRLAVKSPTELEILLILPYVSCRLSARIRGEGNRRARALDARDPRQRSYQRARGLAPIWT